MAGERKFRTLILLDGFTPEVPQIEVGNSLAGFRVVRWLDESQQVREVPEAIPVDNGPEFLTRAVD